MTTNVVLEWKNLNLTIEKKEYNFLKCKIETEQKRILDNGMEILLFFVSKCLIFFSFFFLFFDMFFMKFMVFHKFNDFFDNFFKRFLPQSFFRRFYHRISS